jgi:hypothetical protein
MQLSYLLASKIVYAVSFQKTLKRLKYFNNICHNSASWNKAASHMILNPSRTLPFWRCFIIISNLFKLFQRHALVSVCITVMHVERGMKYALQCSCFIMRMERKPRRMRLDFRSLDVRNLKSCWTLFPELLCSCRNLLTSICYNGTVDIKKGT